MQKLLRRTAQAEKQVARRVAKAQRGQKTVERNERYVITGIAKTEIRRQRKEAVVARREAWQMGPLAPRRSSAAALWGTIASERVNGNFEHPAQFVEARCRWAGGREHLCLAVGDRVAIMEGPHKGQIGPIREISKDTGTVQLEDIGMANTQVHEFLIKEGRTFVRAVEAQIPIDAVRLVHPVRDANTGVTRDVIIRELRPVDIFHDRPTRRTEFSRVVPGLNLEIPWPREADPAYADQPVDTLRIDVEERTFVPTLLRPPLPDRAIDELRNRFSRFRTRHEPEYVAKKEAEAADKARRGKLLQAAMRTPLQEFHIQQKALRRARGQPVLTDDMLEKIGQIIARNKRTALDAVGAEEVVDSSAAARIPLEATIPPPPSPQTASSSNAPEARPPPSPQDL